MKKIWERPMLTVLTKGKPEESVLAACKQWPTSGPSGEEFWLCGIGCDPVVACEAMLAS